MDVREKLVDLLGNIYLPIMAGPDVIGEYRIPHKLKEEIADHLIANGVTVQEWISVKDGLPENGKESVLIALRWGEVDIGWCEDGRWRSEFVNEYEDGEVTHWMPLPEPPKGE